MTNAEIAERLEEVAHLLHEQDADPFRVDAYRRAAATIRTLHEPARDIFEREGLAGLDRIPSVGPVIARAIRSLVLTGHLPMLDRLRGEAHPVSVLATVPGVGPKLAERLEEELGVRTLEELETAAHDGRLAAIPGFGAKRVRSIRDALAGRLARVRAPAPARPSHEPPIDELLDVDREYREKAAAGRLHRIAPRRFNPQGEAWLPILHARRGGRHYTALFSNTAQAHRLGKTHDWVVLYYDGGDGEHQSTVVTAARGPCAGQRVVRGRERESPCAHAPNPAPRASRSRRSHRSTRT